MKQKEMQMNAAFRLVMQTLGRKNFMPNNFLEINQNFALARFYVIMKQDWPIEQCLLHIRVYSLAGKQNHVLIFSLIGL